MVSYYKSKEILARQTKDWIVQYSTAIENQKTPPEWEDFCRTQLMQFGFGKKLVTKFLKEEFGLTITKDNKMVKLDDNAE